MAIGTQTHVSASSPSYEEEDQALTEMEALGLPIHITELDVNSAQGGQGATGADVANNAATTQGGLVSEADKKLADQYSNLFKLFVKHPSVKVVTFWGVNDGVSWRAAGKPLLFDSNDQPKPAFDAVIQVVQNIASTPVTAPNPAVAPKALDSAGWKPATSNQDGKPYPQVDAEGRVRARVVAPQAQLVQLDIGGVKYPLTKSEDGSWIGDSAPQDEGFHYYQLVIDGAQVPDPNSLYFYGASRWGSGIEIPAKDQDFYALKNVPHGQVREVRYFSKSQNSMRHAFVYTPPQYDSVSKQRFPVLYLQHGGGENEFGWTSQGRAGLIMDNLLAQGKAQPFIIVMENGGDIRRSAAPQAPAGGPAPNGGAANAPRGARGPGGRMFDFSGFERLLVDDLIPYIDTNFRTVAKPTQRAMAGLSMGGMQTRTVTLANPKLFSAVGIFSGGSIAPTEIADMAAYKKQMKTVFFSFGGREGGAVSAKANADALKQAGVNSYYYESPLTGHEWQSWRRSFYQFAQLIFKN